MDYKILRSDQTKLDKLALEEYGQELGLSYDLQFVFKTKEQANELLEIQYLCNGLYRNWYKEAIEIKIHDKKREHKKVSDAIEILKNHLWKYHLEDGLDIISKLNEIQPKINKLVDEKVKHKTEPQRLLNEIQNEITERLENSKFSKSHISQKIIPEFTAIIKGKDITLIQ